ncbi:hypothetical protein CWI38_2323p0010, partial [Hamiltosporidium tvaerminnensis]
MQYNRNNSRDNESTSQKRKINFDGDEFELGDKQREESKLEQFFNIDPKAVFSNEAMATEFENIRRYALSNDSGGLNNFSFSEFCVDVGSVQKRAEGGCENGSFKSNEDKRFAVADDFILNGNENIKKKECDIYSQRLGMIRPEYFGRPNTPNFSNLSRREQDIVLNARNIHSVKENNFISNGYNAPLPLFQRHPPIYAHEMPYNRNMEMHKYNQQNGSSMHYMHKQKTNINPTVFMHREKFIETPHRGNSVPNEFYNRYRKDIPMNTHPSNFSRFPPLIQNPYQLNPPNIFPPKNLNHKNFPPPPPYPNTPYPQPIRINSPRPPPFIPIQHNNTPITHINPKLITPSTTREITPTPHIYTKTLKSPFNNRTIDLPPKDPSKLRLVNTPLTPTPPTTNSPQPPPPPNFLSTFPPSFIKTLKIRKIFLSKINVPRSLEKINPKDFLFYLHLINSLLSIHMHISPQEQQILCRLFFISITHNGFAFTEKNLYSLFIEITGKQFTYFKELYLFFIYPLEQIFYKLPVIYIAEPLIIDKKGVILQRMKYLFSYFKLTPLNISMGIKYGNSIDLVWILNVIKNTELPKNMFEDVLSVYYEISSYIGSYSKGDNCKGNYRGNCKDNCKGVSDYGLGIDKEKEGVNNTSDKQHPLDISTINLHPVNNTSDNLSPLNDSTNNLHPVNNSSDKEDPVNNKDKEQDPVNKEDKEQDPVNNITNTLHPVSNSTSNKRYKCVKGNKGVNNNDTNNNDTNNNYTNNSDITPYDKGVNNNTLSYHRLHPLSLINLILLREQCLDIIIDSLDIYFNDSLKYLKYFILSPSSLHRFIDSIFIFNKICNNKIKEENKIYRGVINKESGEGVSDKKNRVEGVSDRSMLEGVNNEYDIKGVNTSTSNYKGVNDI